MFSAALQASRRVPNLQRCVFFSVDCALGRGASRAASDDDGYRPSLLPPPGASSGPRLSSSSSPLCCPCFLRGRAQRSNQITPKASDARGALDEPVNRRGRWSLLMKRVDRSRRHRLSFPPRALGRRCLFLFELSSPSELKLVSRSSPIARERNKPKTQERGRGATRTTAVFSIKTLLLRSRLSTHLFFSPFDPDLSLSKKKKKKKSRPLLPPLPPPPPPPIFFQ